MGLLTALITLPLAPVRGVMWVAEQVSEQAARELYDETAIRRQLEELEVEHASGEVDDEAYAARQEILLQRLLGGNEGER